MKSEVTRAAGLQMSKQSRTHKGKHSTAAGVTKAHPIGTKPARRKANKQARASRKANR